MRIGTGRDIGLCHLGDPVHMLFGGGLLWVGAHFRGYVAVADMGCVRGVKDRRQMITVGITRVRRRAVRQVTSHGIS